MFGVDTCGEVSNDEVSAQVFFDNWIFEFIAIGVDEQQVEWIELSEEVIDELLAELSVVRPVADDLLERDFVHGGAEVSRVAVVGTLLLELEGNCARLLDFIVDPGIGLEPRAVVDDQVVHLLVLLLSVLGQLDLKSDYRLAGHVVTVTANLARVFVLLEDGQQGVLALVAQDVREVLFRVVAVVRTQRIHYPEELHDGLVLDGFHAHHFTDVGGLEVQFVFYLGKLLVCDLEEEGDGPGLHLLDGEGGKKHGIDAIAAVLPLVELPEVLPHQWVGKSLIVAN
jgi:hypothetical protein